MTILTGLSAFPLTPSNAEGRVDVAALRRLIRLLCEAEVDSIGVLGSTGSYPYLTRTERRRALDAALAEANGRVPVLVGVGALRTDEAVRLAQDAKAAGAAVGLLAPVSYTPLTEEEVFEHFVAVSRSSGLPLCIYDNPGTTHFTFSPALVGRLSHVDGIVALKSPATDPAAIAARLATLRALVPARFTLGSSVDWHAAEALLAGSDAWYSVAAGLLPRPCLRLVKAVRDKDQSEVRRLDAALRPLWDLFQTFSGLRVIYACADLLGLCRTAPPRPILPLPGPARDRVAAVLGTLDLN